ncbi:MAG: hypothetical protein R3F34_17750 [Planctomycetota bacterium]
MSTTVLRLLVVACALVAPGCAGTRSLFGLDDHPLGPWPGDDLSGAQVDAQLEVGRRELADGRDWEAVRRSLELIEDSDLDTERGNAATRLLLDAMTDAVATTEDSSGYERIRASRLPRAVRAIRTVGLARKLLEEGEPFEAYLEIQRLENVYPSHHLSREAGDVVADAGVALYESKGHYMLFFADRSRAPTVFEYLVLRHPTHPRCDDAYWLLGTYAADHREYQRAIGYFEDLVLFHPGSPHAIAAEAEVPKLRIADHVRYDFDFGAILKAFDETNKWLARHCDRDLGPEHAELVDSMRELRQECLVRYARADLGIARFYARVGQDFGANKHAQRALDVAREAGSAAEAEQEEARAIIAAHPLGEPVEASP